MFNREGRQAAKELRAARERAAADPTAVGDLALALAKAGMRHLNRGELPQAEALFTEQVEVARAAGLPGAQAAGVVNTGEVRRFEQRFAEAAQLYEAALEILSEHTDWEKTINAVHWKLVAVRAAERAGIPVPDELAQAAASHPEGQSWVYEVDQARSTETHAPPEAIIRGWEVRDGELTGTVVANPNYRKR